MRKFVSIFICLTMIISIFSFSQTASAASETDYVARFTLTTNKSKSIAKGDIIKVNIALKTNYPIYTVSLPVVYKTDKFVMKNTDNTDLKSYLTFSGKLASSYVTNGNWKSPDAMYSRNSNPAYWNSVKDEYKITFATWTADSTKSNTPVKLSSSETIVSFELEAKTFIDEIVKEDLYIPSDFQKTSSCPGGLLFVGRCVGENISNASFAATGQTIYAEYNFKNVEAKRIKTSMNYKSEKDLMTYVEEYSEDKCEFTSSNGNVISLDGSNAKATARGNAEVTVTAGTDTVAVIEIDVTYTWWQWVIVIVFFGWIWY